MTNAGSHNQVKVSPTKKKPIVTSPNAVGGGDVNRATPGKIVYPLFQECAQYTLDAFWQQVFQDCARGKFPKGCSPDQQGETLIIRSKNGTNKAVINYKLSESENSPEKIFKDLKILFQDHLNIKSMIDREEIRAELDEICKSLQESFSGNWQQIKRKKIKDPIIRRYILDLKERHQLNDRETAEVAQLIKLGFLFNWISNENVIYQDQQIVDIETLQFNEEDRTFHLEEQITTCTREYKPKLFKLANLWEKFLEQPKNRYLI